VNFTQTISIRSQHPEALIDLAARWDENQAASDILGYIGSRVLADRENPGQYLIVADFGIVDPDVPAAEEAMRNNDRPETQLWAQMLREVIEDEPVYRNYDEVYRTGG
jgi:hypothetical protein